MNQKFKKILQFKNCHFVKPFKIAIGLFIAYLLLAYFAVNPIAKRVLPWVAEHNLASRMTVGQVKFDPFGLVLTVDNLRLTKPNGAPLAGFKHLAVNLEASGVFHLAWRLKDIHLTAPEVMVDIAPDGTLNWADLIARLNKDKKPDDTQMTRVLIDHLLIEGGDIQYTERNRPTPFQAVFEPLGLELEGLSTLPEDRGDYLISAQLPEQGGTIKWKGSLALNPIASTGSVDIKGVHLAKMMQVLKQQALPFTLTTGDLQTSFGYKFAMVKAPVKQPAPTDSAQLALPPVPEVRLENLAVRLSNLAANLQGDAQLALDDLQVKLPALDFSMFNGAQFKFAGLDIAAQQLILTQGKERLFKLHEAAVNGVDFDLAANQLKVGEIALQAGEVNATRAKDGSINWQQLLPANTQAAPDEAANNQSDIKPEKKPLNFDLASFKLEHWQAAVHDQSFVHPLDTVIKDINLNLTATNADGGVILQQTGAELGGISVQSALYPQALASLDKISLQNGVVNLKDSSVNLPELVISGLQTQVLREANKSINWQTALEQVASTQSVSPVKSKAFYASGWKVSLAKLALQKSGVHIEDKTTSSPVVLDIQNALFELSDASLDLAKPMPVKAKFQVKQGGQFDMNGKVALMPFKADVQIKLDALSLKPFSPYITQVAYLKLKDGQANVNGKLVMKAGQSVTGQFVGGFSINQLALNEEPDDALFLGWKSVSSTSLKLAFAPNQLHMDGLRIEQATGKFIIFEDKTLNVKRILRTSATASASTATNQVNPSTASAQPADTGAAETFPVSIDRVSIDNAELEFADLSLKPQFGTHINTLTGVINGLSSNPSTTAQVELDGKVDEFGSARVRGSVQPFRATDFTDLKLSFRNLEMNRLTPYSGKFAGRKIDSGKLSVDLEYKIKQRQLTGENKFVINKLKLGERVDSPDAMHLPLDLAIALLEDSDGLIDLDLPISGSLDDPQFSYGKIVWKAILNVFEKIVTSPFRLLGKLLGVSSDKLEAVSFDPGSATLAPEEQEKLKAVAGGMAKRASLTLKIVPAYDAIVDKAALQELATRRDVMKDMGIKLQDGEQPGPLDLNNVKVQSSIENMLKERKGEGRSLKALESLKDYFKKSKPEDVPKYAEMLQQLKLTANVFDADLTALAKARASAMQNYLVKNSGLTADRVSIAEPTKLMGDGKTINLKMELGVSKK